MIELARIVEHQASLSSYRATQNQARASQLELLIELTKSKNLYHEWHGLIATPFRYGPPPPHFQARFRPAYGKNVFYGSCIEETALHEYTYHFMKQRIHLNISPESGLRTIFFVDANDKHSFQLIDEKNYETIMDKNDYAASHQFVKSNPHVTFIVYPSCRDPKRRNNAAILDINLIDKIPKWESPIKFFYDNNRRQISWIDYDINILWDHVR